MQKKQTYTYQLSLSDVQVAIEQYLRSNGEYVTITNITPEYLQKEIAIGTHDCDYVEVFDGVKVQAELDEMYVQYKYLLMQNVVYELIPETGKLKDTGLTAKDVV